MFPAAFHAMSTKRLIVGAAVAAVAVMSAAIGAYLSRTTPDHGDPETSIAPQPPVAGRPSSQTADRSPEPLASLDQVSEPADFADAVAHALFDWDTTLPTPLSEHSVRLLAVADPTGRETSRLVADLAAYLPTTETWSFLQQYYTRQWIEVDSVAIPELWPQAVAEAGPGGFAPGTTAFTVEGTRHRSGIWEGEDVTSEHDVSFTVFMVCRPSYSTCHVLRLSRLGEPLE